MPLPKKYREKYRVELKSEEKVTYLAAKVVGITTLFLLTGLAIDIYKLFH